MLGVSVGGRISELLGLVVSDVWQSDQPVTDLHFHKSIVKGKEESRTVPVNSDGIKAIRNLIDWHREAFDELSYSRHLFVSQSAKGTYKPMGRRMATVVLKKAFNDARLTGNLGTHTLRKSFAQRLYEATGDIFVVQEMLGHKSVATTQKYLGVNYANVKDAVEIIAVDSRVVTYASKQPVFKADDDALIAELARRGYGNLEQVTK